MITVNLPDGRQVNVATDDPQKAAAVAHKYRLNNPHPEASSKNEMAGVAGHYLDGILPGASGFVRGAREVVKNAVQAPFDSSVNFHPMQSYNEGRAFQEARNKMAAQDHPTASSAAEWAGMGSGLFLPASKIAKGASLAQKAAAGAKTAGLYGTLSGAMSSKADSLIGKATDAVSSGILSAGVGMGLPYATRLAGRLAAPFTPVTNKVTEWAGKGLEGLGDILPGRIGTALSAEGSQLARDPARAAANRQLDTTIRAQPHPVTGNQLRPMDVTAEVQRRNEFGVPAVPADLNEGLRRSFGAAARSPGPATMAVRRAIDERKQQEVARAASHLQDSLGPTTNVDAQAEALKEYGKWTSKPLYDISDAQHVPYVQELQDLFQRPSARDAVQVAGRQILDKGERPHEFGLIEGPDGVFQMGPAPTMPLYDRVKTVLDKTVYDGAKPLAAPEVTRASEGAMSIRNRLLQIMDGDGSGPQYRRPGQGMTTTPQGGPVAPSGGVHPQEARQALPSYPDLPKAPPMGGMALPHPSAFPKDPQPGNPWPVPYEAPTAQLYPETPPAPAATPQGPQGSSIPPEGLNPHWKVARDAYGGPVQARQAMELGNQLATGDAADAASRAAGLTGSQLGYFRLGHRSGLADDIRTLPDYGDASKRLAGSPAKRDAIRAIHGDDAAHALGDRLGAERDATETWQTIRGRQVEGSTNLGEQDQQIEDAATGLVQTLAGHPGRGLVNIGRALARGDRMTPEVNGHVASVLGESDPAAVRDAMRAINRERARRTLVERNAARAVQQGGRFLGDVFGTGMIAPADDQAPY